mgnify:CR=1 FL=1
MSSDESQKSHSAAKPFVGVHLKCCNVYVRAYVNAAHNAFVTWCPRCAAPVRVPIVKEGGSTSRFFTGE